MIKFLYSNRLIIGVLTGVILIVVGGTFFYKHLVNERMLEKERNMRLDYKQWHLPEGVKARIGSGTIRTMQYSPDGNLLAVVSDIGVWILNGKSADAKHLLAAHTGVINSISFSPDGSTLAVGTENGTVQLWYISTGEHQKTFTRRDYFFGVDNVFFMPDGSTLAVVYSSALLDLWNVATGIRKNTISAVESGTNDDNINNIPNMYMSFGGYNNSFSSDGKTVANAKRNDTFSFWDIATRKEIRVLKVGASRSSRRIFSFTSDLRTLAIASESYKNPRRSRIWEINLWDVNSQTQQKIFETDAFEIPFLVFSTDGNLLASSVNGTIHIWDVNTSKEKRKIKGYRSRITALTFSPDNRTLVSSSWDDTLRFWDVDTGKEKKKIAGYGGFSWNVSLSADTQTLIRIRHGTGIIHQWNTNTGQHENTFIGHTKHMWDAVLSSDGSKLACHSILRRTIHLWDIKTGKLSKLKGPRKHISGIAFRRDGKVLASWGTLGKRRNIIKHWDIEMEGIQRTLQLNYPDELSVLEDLYFDKELFAGIEKFDPNLFVWNLVTGDYNITDLGETEIGVGQFSPDGRVLAIVFGGLTKSDKLIVLRDVETGEHIRTLTGHTGEVKCITFSPDSGTLASGGEFLDKTIRLWDIETGSSRILTDPSWTDSQQKFDAITTSVLAFSPDGQTLASGMKLGDIYLWETTTGEKKSILRGHSMRISHLFFRPDGKSLISVSNDGTILIWDLTHH